MVEELKMNYRYLIKKINGKKLIDRLLLNAHNVEVPTLNHASSKSIVLDIITHEESAFLYQLVKTIYEMNQSVDEFHKDRLAYQSGNPDSVSKLSSLLLHSLVFIDFSGVFTQRSHIKKTQYEAVAKQVFEKGIILQLDPHLQSIHYLPYHKSGSMGRQSVVSFIASQYKPILDEKLNFDLIFENRKYTLSKLQAYQGLYFSSGRRIDGLGLNEKNVIVVGDYNKPNVTELYKTALSKSLLKEMINSICFDSQKESTWNYEILGSMIYSKQKSDKFINIFELNKDFNIIKDHYQSSNESKTNIKNYLDTLDEDIKHIYISIQEKLIAFFDLKNLNDDEFIMLDKVNINSKTNMFDGLGFIDKTFIEFINTEKLFKSLNNYHYSIQIRMPFVKGILHAVDFSQWFEDQKVDSIKDIFGISHNVSEVKIILTQSQFKCLEWLLVRFEDEIISGNREIPMKHYFEHFNRFDHALYITNTDSPENEDFDTILNYQILHTPALNRESFIKLLEKGNTHYVDLSTKRENQIEFFLKTTSIGDLLNESEVEQLDDLDILSYILNKNQDFIYDQILQNRLAGYLKSLLKNMKIGRIKTEGEVRFLSGDLLELLVRITYGVAYNSIAISLNDRFYAPSKYSRYKEDVNYSILRNPHITSRELVLAKPIEKEKNTLREKYFSHLTGIIMLNSFADQMLAMQTADTDGDIVRIVANPIYNSAVLESNNRDSLVNTLYGSQIVQRLYFPSLKGIKKNPTFENLYESTVASFSTRIGIMSNYALTHSIIAYNENNPDIEKRDFHKLEAEKMSFIISSEIDSVKSGKAPYFKGKSGKNNFIKFKNKIENNQVESIDFHFNDTSPNLDYLKQNSEKVLNRVKKIKQASTVSNKDVKIFDFEMFDDWKSTLNASLLKEVSKRMIAFKDWDKTYRYSKNQKDFFSSTIVRTLYYILSIQYDDHSMPIVLENLLTKLMTHDLDILISARDATINDKWHFLRDLNDKYDFVSKYLPDIFNDLELELIMNFNDGGHKILYLILSHVISVQSSLIDEGFKDYDSIKRYQHLIENILKRVGILHTIDMSQVLETSLKKRTTTDSIMKKFFNQHIDVSSSNYQDLKVYLDKMLKLINVFKKNHLDYTLNDLNDMSKYFNLYMSYTKDTAGHNIPLWLIKSKIKKVIDNDFERLFKSYDVNRFEDIKYLYALRNIDSSLNFAFFTAHKNFLHRIIESGGNS